MSRPQMHPLDVRKAERSYWLSGRCRGHSVIVIEHRCRCHGFRRLDRSTWAPGSGDSGGRLVARNRPGRRREVADANGQVLANALATIGLAASPKEDPSPRQNLGEVPGPCSGFQRRASARESSASRRVAMAAGVGRCREYVHHLLRSGRPSRGPPACIRSGPLRRRDDILLGSYLLRLSASIQRYDQQ